MKRRTLLLGLGAASLGGSLAGCAWMSGPPKLDFSLAAPTAVRFDTRKRRTMIPRGVLGLTLQAAWLQSPRALSADDATLNGLLQDLGPARLFSAGPRDSGAASLPSTLQLQRLRALLTAHDATLIYRLPAADAARAAADATTLQQALGERLRAVELAPGGDDASQYLAGWTAAAVAIRRASPQTVLAGPGVVDPEDPQWMDHFLTAAGAAPAVFSAHVTAYPPPAPRSPFGPQGGGVFALPAATRSALDTLAAAAQQHQHPCYLTGARAVDHRHGVGTLAAALWALDLLMQTCGNATAPWAGACFDHALVLDDAGRLRAGPVYYALRLLALMLPAQRLDTQLQMPRPPGVDKSVKLPPSPLHAHALLDAAGHPQVLLINTDGLSSVDVRIDAERALAGGRILRLTGATLDADRDVRLASAAVDAQGHWSPAYTEHAQIDSGTAYLTIGAGSAVLVQLT